MSQSYLDEIDEQPDAIRSLAGLVTPELRRSVDGIRAALARGDINHIALTGMGGSLFNGYGTWLRLSRALDVPVSLWDSSELIQQAPSVLRPKTLVIAISQSGESVELRRMTEIGGPSMRVSITNGPENSLSRWATIRLATRVGPEQTVSTKTYTAGHVALYIFERLLTGDDDAIESQIEALADATRATLFQLSGKIGDILSFVGHDRALTFIGRGASYASAMMAALVTAEAAKAPTQALSGGQFRHGPLELVRDGFRSIMFMGHGATRALNRKTAEDIDHLGGRCLIVAPADFTMPETDRIKLLSLPDVGEALMPVLEILPLQLLMVPMAIARGFEPAKFLNGTKVTTIE